MSRYINKTRFSRKTCNTIDDVTGLIDKLDQTMTRWDGVQCSPLNYEDRQPQDFPVFPRPPTTYSLARSEVAEPIPAAYNPANGWSYPT